jgi:putative SOS response-associated peptidase YedK
VADRLIIEALFAPEAVAKTFGLTHIPGFSARFNVAPPQLVVGIRLQNGNRQASFLRWCLISSWTDDPIDVLTCLHSLHISRVVKHHSNSLVVHADAAGKPP